MVGTGTLSLGGAAAVSSTGLLVQTGILTQTVENALSGSASLQVQSTAWLSHSNNYTGGTTLQGGTLLLGSGAALGSGSLTFGDAGGGTIQPIGSSCNVQNDLTILGTAQLAGSFDLNLSGNVMLGRVRSGITNNLSNGNNATLSGSIYITQGGDVRSFNFLGSGSTVVTGQIFDEQIRDTGSGTLFFGGSGRLSLLHSNSYTGNTIVNGTGTLVAGAANAIGPGEVDVYSGTLSLNAANAITANRVFASGGTLVETAPGALGGTAQVIVSTGTVILSQPNTNNGGVQLVNGTLSLQSPGAVSAGQLYTGSIGTFNVTVPDAISGTALLSVGQVTTLPYSNDYTGGTSVGAGGKLIAANPAALGSGSVTLTGGILDLTHNIPLSTAYPITAGNSSTLTIDDASVAAVNAVDQTFGSLTLSSGTFTVSRGSVTTGTPRVTFGDISLPDFRGRTMTLVPTNVSLVAGAVTSHEAGAIGTLLLMGNSIGNILNGVISDGNAGGGLAVVKSDPGTWTLKAANTYSGTTTVLNGRLLIANTSGSALGTGSVYVSAGTLGGSGTISGSISVRPSATLAPGADGVPGTLTASTVGFSDGAQLAIQLNSDTQICDQLICAGKVSLGTTTFALLNVTDLGSTSLTIGSSFTIVNAAGGVNGIFAGLPEGSTISAGLNQYVVSYATPDDVMLTVIPEPASLGAWAGAAMAFIGRRRKDRW